MIFIIALVFTFKIDIVLPEGSKYLYIQNSSLSKTWSREKFKFEV